VQTPNGGGHDGFRRRPSGAAAYEGVLLSCTLTVRRPQKEGACRRQQQERGEGVGGIGRVVVGVDGAVLGRKGRVVCVWVYDYGVREWRVSGYVKKRGVDTLCNMC
jgi:hypothetical protein